MKKLIALIAAAGVVAALAVPAFAGTRTIKVGDDWYVSKSGAHVATIRKGSSVKWVFTGKRAHNVYQLKGPGHFHSPTHVKGTFVHRFTKKGTYTFVCTLHPGMQMTLHVK